MENKIFVGTDLKFKLDITSPGFSMETDDFEVDLSRGQNTLHFEKEDLVVDDQDNYYVCFSSSALGAGTVKATITAHVPDEDFEDGIRDEVYKFDLVSLTR